MTAPQEYATIEIGDLTEEELDQFRTLAIRIVERHQVPWNQDKATLRLVGRLGVVALVRRPSTRIRGVSTILDEPVRYGPLGTAMAR